MKLNRQYQNGGEFKARQGRFDFAEVALAVLDIALYVKSSITSWLKKEMPKVVQAMTRKPEQLILNFAGLPVSFNGQEA